MRQGFIYHLLVVIVRVVMFFWHPVFRVVGRENAIKDGRAMICANHSGMADPIWIIFALRLGHVPRIMAKKEVMDVPFLGGLLRYFGVFGVDRGAADITAIKTGLRCLHDEQQLLIFPEGTRVKSGQKVSPKRGAVMLAARAQAPIIPVYLTAKRYPFSPLTCVIGEPYLIESKDKRMSDGELQCLSEELMKKIYGLGEHI